MSSFAPFASVICLLFIPCINLYSIYPLHQSVFHPLLNSLVKAISALVTECFDSRSTRWLVGFECDSKCAPMEWFRQSLTHLALVISQNFQECYSKVVSASFGFRIGISSRRTGFGKVSASPPLGADRTADARCSAIYG
jgi:hypothetical protein